MENKIVHGGDWAGFQKEFGYEPLDFSMNVNPAGMPEPVKQAIIDSAKDAWKYPDPLCRELISVISEHEGCPENNIMCGCGAADLIYRCVLAAKPKKALITAPAFGEYEDALRLTDCEILPYFLKKENGFRLDEGILDAIDDSVDMFFICEPNNPTGVTTGMTLLKKILDKCEQTGTRLIVDECFNDFLENPQEHTLKGQIASHPRLLILKALTKNYSMAGVRLGYCMCSDEVFLEQIRISGQPWPVSVMAQRAGIAAFGQAERIKDLGKAVKKERIPMIQKLKEFGFLVVEGEANYILFQTEPDLLPYLRSKGILIRNCSNYRNLGEGWFRVAVKTKEDNDRLLKEIGVWCNE